MTVTLTLAPINDPDLPPGMRLTVVSDSMGTVPIEVRRIHADGSEHRIIASSRPYLIAGAWTEADFYAPYNTDVTWRVTSSVGSASAVDMVASESAWLVPPSDPSQAVRLDEVVNLSSRTRQTRAGKFQPVADGTNGTRPRAVWVGDGGRGGHQVTARVRVADDGPLWDLLESDTVVLFVTPGDGWRVKWMWAQVTRDEWANPGRAFWPYDEVDLALDEAADFQGDLLPVWTAGDVEAMAAGLGLTADGLAGLYATDLDMQIDNRIT